MSKLDRTGALVAFGAAALSVALGVAFAARHFPGGFDWAYTVISRLASERRNPDGAVWLSAGFFAGMLLLWPVAGHLARVSGAGRPDEAGPARASARIPALALRLGVLGGILLGLEGLLGLDLSVVHRKGHEALALLTFLGFYGGVLGLHVYRIRHVGASVWPALLVFLPLCAVGVSQVVLYFDQRDLGWVDTEWREMGIPVWISFAFWQWLAVGFLTFGLGYLVVARWREGCGREGGRSGSRGRAGSRGLAVGALVALAVGCASGGGGGSEAPSPDDPDADRQPAASVDSPVSGAPAPEDDPGPWEHCQRNPEPDEDVVEQSRRVLAETFCGATLWFDGLFGSDPDVAAARATSGRVELSTMYSDFYGVEVDGRLRLHYELPNLERRVNLVLGRGDSDEMVQDREEGSALGSAASGVEAARSWLAGVGLSGPGRWAERVEFRAGVDVSTRPGLFAQGRLRQVLPVSETATWTFRETLFWRQRDGFGLTGRVDHDRALSPLVVFHWGTTATLSEVSDGVVWRSAGVLYRHLGQGRGVAGELFLRGATSAEVALQDYGVRAALRVPLGRPYLFGEIVLGYSWPQTDPLVPRRGSPAIGVGTEMLFGTRLVP